MRNTKNARNVAAITVAVLGLSVFGGVATAGHDFCHAWIGNLPGSNFGPSCHFEADFEAEERGEFWAIADEGGWEVTVTAVETLNSNSFAAGISFPDGTTDYHVTGRPDELTVDPLLSSGRMQATFEIDGSAYELIVELVGQEGIQYERTGQAALLLYRNADGRVNLFRGSEEVFDLAAGGQIRRFVSARFEGGVGVGGCLGPICF